MAEEWSFEHGGRWKAHEGAAPGDVIQILDLAGVCHTYVVTEVVDGECTLLPDPANGQFILPHEMGNE